MPAETFRLLWQWDQAEVTAWSVVRPGWPLLANLERRREGYEWPAVAWTLRRRVPNESTAAAFALAYESALGTWDLWGPDITGHTAPDFDTALHAMRQAIKSVGGLEPAQEVLSVLRWSPWTDAGETSSMIRVEVRRVGQSWAAWSDDWKETGSLREITNAVRRQFAGSFATCTLRERAMTKGAGPDANTGDAVLYRLRDDGWWTVWSPQLLSAHGTVMTSAQAGVDLIAECARAAAAACGRPAWSLTVTIALTEDMVQSDLPGHAGTGTRLLSRTNGRISIQPLDGLPPDIGGVADLDKAVAALARAEPSGAVTVRLENSAW